MSDKFYEATRVSVDGRLMKRFRGVRPKGQSSKIRLDQDIKVVDTVVNMTREGHKTADIAYKLGISSSSVLHLKRIFVERL